MGYRCFYVGETYEKLSARSKNLNINDVIVSMGVREDPFNDRDFFVYKIEGDDEIVFFRFINGCVDWGNVETILELEVNRVIICNPGLNVSKDSKSIIGIDLVS